MQHDNDFYTCPAFFDYSGYVYMIGDTKTGLSDRDPCYANLTWLTFPIVDIYVDDNRYTAKVLHESGYYEDVKLIAQDYRAPRITHYFH